MIVSRLPYIVILIHDLLHAHYEYAIMNYCIFTNEWCLNLETSCRQFADDIFKRIFLNENAWISLKISLKFVPKIRNNNVAALVHIMAWCRPGDKPLSGPMLFGLLTHICVTGPQRVKCIYRWLLSMDSCIRIQWRLHSFHLVLWIMNDVPNLKLKTDLYKWLHTL